MSDAQLTAAFFAALAATVIALAVSIALAHKHRRTAHVQAVGVMLGFLVLTLVAAEALGRRFTFVQQAYDLHMPFAYAAAGLLVLPLVTGALHWKGKVTRRAHVVTVGVWLLAVLAALGTGVWMFSGATPKAGALGAAATVGDSGAP